jgi:hypothetical protein
MTGCNMLISTVAGPDPVTLHTSIYPFIHTYIHNQGRMAARSDAQNDERCADRKNRDMTNRMSLLETRDRLGHTWSGAIPYLGGSRRSSGIEIWAVDRVESVQAGPFPLQSIVLPIRITRTT